MEKKLAERLAAKAAAGELSGERERVAPRVEGVPRASEPPVASGELERAPASGVLPSTEDAASPPLTYAVYTVADLEARGQARAAIASAQTGVPSRVRWAEVARSVERLVRAFSGWRKAPSPRPRCLDVCRVPLEVLAADTKAALRVLPWRTIAAGAAIACGSAFLLLFVVLTVAELTDDLKPARPASKAAVAALAVEAPAALTVATAEEGEPLTIELEDTAPVAKPARAAPASAKKAAPKRKKTPELFEP